MTINSVYGKTMENLRERIIVKVVNSEKDFLKHVSNSAFISTKIFDKKFAAIPEIKPVLTFNKPIYVRFTVLELSKWWSITSITTLLKNTGLLFTDTHSCTYEIKSEDAYEEFFKRKYLFDLSNYPKDSSFLILSMKTLLVK